MRRSIVLTAGILMFTYLLISSSFADETNSTEQAPALEQTTETTKSSNEQAQPQAPQDTTTAESNKSDNDLGTDSVKKPPVTPNYLINSGGKSPYASTEQFSVEPSSGSASLSVPIVVPQGRKGIQPNISLMYSSGSGNGPLGVGWILELGSIQRSTKKGTPKYDNTDTFVFVQAGSSQELVNIGGNEYRPKIEGAFMKIVNNGSSGWLVTDKRGTKYYFGQTQVSQQYDPGNSSKIFKWCLDKVEDLFGNYMELIYTKANEQIYPKFINYSGEEGVSDSSFAQIEFNYQDQENSRSDKPNNRMPGFIITTYWRLDNIKVKAKVNGQYNLQRKYQLTYTESPDTYRSMLHSIKLYDSNNANLPATVFDYKESVEKSFSPFTTWLTGWTNGSNWTRMTGDFNGDGLTDFAACQISDGLWYISLNLGNGSFTSPQLAVQYNWTNGPNFARMAGDFNGDGLTDFAACNIYLGEWEVSLNLGNGSFTYPFTSWLSNSPVEGDWTIMSGDFNGDGLTDFAIYNPDPNDPDNNVWKIALNSGSVPDLLYQTNNAIGATTNITYTPSTQYDNTGGDGKCDLPFPLQTVSSVTTTDNVIGQSYTTTYEYKNGLFDFQDREFRGFGYVKVKDVDNNYSETTFYQDDLFKGRPKEQATYDSGGNLYGKSVNTYSSQNIYPGVEFVYSSKIDNFIYDGDSTGHRTQAQYFYEESPQYGNLTKSIELGEVDINSGSDLDASDNRYSFVEYLDNNDNYLIGVPKTTYLKDTNGNILKQSWFYYDNQGYGLAPTLGNLTKQEDYLEGGVNPATSFSYDGYGNLLTTTDSLGRTTTISYDSDYHLFPLTTTNTLGQTVSSEYYGVNGVSLDDGTYKGLWGQVKSATDTNNVTSYSTYDSFGRAVKTIGPDDTADLPTTSVEYNLTTLPINIVTHSRINHNQSPTLDSITFYDGLGRGLQSKTPSEVTGQYVVSGQTEYNSRGLPIKKYLPFFSTNPMNSVEPINSNNPHSTIDYDAIGRAVKSTNPDGSYSSVLYNDWTTTGIDENGHKQTAYTDAFGRLIKKEEYEGADGRSPNYPSTNYSLYAATLYEYDTVGNLTKTTDAHNNQTTISYDSLGRKTSMNDLDMGTWRYEYDAVGNLKKQTDNKNQIINFTYDNLNRLTNKSNGADLNVTYSYDKLPATPKPPKNIFGFNTINTGDYLKGRLVQAQYQTNANTQFNYDKLGRENKSVKVIDNVSYEVNRTYDALNRLTSVKYPDQGQVSYTYTAAGQIETVRDISNSDSYTKLLLHNDGPDGSTNFLDTSLSNYSISANGGAQIDTAQSKFGGASGLFDGNGDYLSISDSADWDVFSGDGTIDFWVKFNVIHTAALDGQTDNVIMVQSQAGEENWYISLNTYYGSPYWQFSYHHDGQTRISVFKPTTVTTGVWYHVAFVRSGNVYRCFQNGVQVGEDVTETYSYVGFAAPLTIGCPTAATLNGWLDEVRISKGLARWTSNFTPPNKEYSSNIQYYVTNVNYNASGAITSIQYGNGDVTNYTYDSLTLRLTNLKTTNSKGQVLQDLSYAYDSSGNITQITDRVNTGSQTFTYDELNRLITASGGYGTKTYSYDQIGNITNKEGLSYSYSAQKPHAVISLSDGTTFEYDTNGNMSSMVKGATSTSYAYDSENRLKEVKKNSALLSQFEYDGDGGRTKKIAYTAYKDKNDKNPFASLKKNDFAFDLCDYFNYAKGNISSFLCKEAEAATLTTTTKFVGSLYEETNGATTRHIFLGNTRIASITNGQTYYFHDDHLGSTNVLTDNSGNVKEVMEYLPFGGFSRHDKLGNDTEKAWFYFTGKQLDEETGLYYYGARYYNPSLGRWITADPTVQNPTNPQTLNRYSYCSNNPVNLVDPNGLGFKKWFKNFFSKNAGVIGLLFGFPGLIAASIYTGNWEPIKNIGMATAMGFVFGGPIGAVAAFISTNILETQPGRQTVNWIANEIFDDVLGMRPRAAYFWSYLITDALLTAGISYKIEKMMNPSNAKVVNPEKLTDSQLKEYEDIAFDETAMMKTNTDGSSVGQMPLSSRKALLVDGHVKAIIANRPAFDIPFLPFQHTAVAIPGGGNFNNGAGYLWNTGVCHQARMRALESIGITNLTPPDLSGQFSNWLSYGVYGTYGGMGYTIDNISKAAYYTRENSKR